MAFGDTFINYINNYHKINKENNVTIIITSELEKKLAEFFFTKNNIKETFFLIPAFVPVYPIFEILNRKRGLSSNMGYDLDNAKLIVKNLHKKILINKLKDKIYLVSSDLRKIQDKKYFVIFVKHYDKNINNINGSFSRQTSKFYKIFQIIDFLKAHKITVLIFGNKYEESVQIIKKKYKDDKTVLFFYELSKSYSIIDQLFVFRFSSLCIGSNSGAFIIPTYLKKKIIFFDGFSQNFDSLTKAKNIKNFYKTILYRKKNYIFTYKILLEILNKKKLGINIKYEIKENSFDEMKSTIEKNL